MKNFPALLGIICIAAMLAIMPGMAMADGPHDFKNDSTTNVTIDGNSGTAIIVSGHHNHVTIHVERTRHDNRGLPPTHGTPRTKSDFFTVKHSRSGPDERCDTTMDEHARRLNDWNRDLRTLYAKRN